MRLFIYYAVHSFLNTLKKLLKTWVAVFLVIGIGGALIGGQHAGRLWGHDIAKPVLPMHIAGRMRRANQRSVRAAHHWHLTLPQQLSEPQRIVRDDIDCLIACDSRNPDDLQPLPGGKCG